MKFGKNQSSGEKGDVQKLWTNGGHTAIRKTFEHFSPGGLKYQYYQFWEVNYFFQTMKNC
jgi:hypothetical protein